jgi:membrane fusion protein, adhesin transport system
MSTTTHPSTHPSLEVATTDIAATGIASGIASTTTTAVSTAGATGLPVLPALPVLPVPVHPLAWKAVGMSEPVDEILFSTNTETAQRRLRGFGSYHLAATPRGILSVGKVIALLFVILIAALIFVPWQQNVTGGGKLTSFAPGVRPQTIESQINGRITSWRVNEGMNIRKGDTIGVLQDLNVNFMDNDFLERIEEVRNRTVGAQEFAIETAKQRTVQALQRLLAAEAAFDNARIEIQTARVRYKRAQDLQKEGLAAVRELETAQLNLQKGQADSIRAETNVEAGKRDVNAARFDENRVTQQADALIAEVELRLANARQRGGAGVVIAPIDGVVVRVAAAGLGQTVKEGDMLAMIVPASSANDQAVEIMISSRDAAIVDVGRPVRLQFSGFPAFVLNPGWQNFSLNTFGGKVAVVDAVDDGDGYYRVLVVPDPTQPQGKWPSQQQLRQGTSATGWILLNDVPIGFEIWRQMNGFPPVLPTPMGKSDKSDKSDKSGKGGKK